MADTQAKFLTGSLFRHVTVMSLTASIGLMAVFFVDLVDMIFISMLGQAELAAAIGYSGAILFFTTSFGIGLAIAVGARVARSLGAGDEAQARAQMTHGMLFSAALSVVFAVIVWFIVPQLVHLIGARGDTADLAVRYLRIIMPSLPFLIAGMIGGAILRAFGAANLAMWVTISGGIVNAVLDPILIFGLALELDGAALASLAARISMGLCAIYFINKYHGGFVSVKLPDVIADASPLLAIGVPAILTQLATPIGQAVVTRSMAAYGEEAVAGMAIVARIMPVAFGVIFALSGAVGPIIGQNYGAGAQNRVREAFRDALIFVALVVVTVACILFALRGPIADLFGATGVARDIVYLFCGPLALAFFFNGVLFVSNAAFNNLGYPFYSTAMNWGRNTLAMVPFVLLGAWLFGPVGVMLGEALSAMVFGIIAWRLAGSVMSDGGRKEARPIFARDGRLLALLNLRR